MKNLFVVALLVISSVSFGQIKLNSHPLELKKSKAFHQILTTYNTKTNDVFVFATDKEITTILKYNTALFFEDSLTATRPAENFKNLSGYSFETCSC